MRRFCSISKQSLPNKAFVDLLSSAIPNHDSFFGMVRSVPQHSPKGKNQMLQKVHCLPQSRLLQKNPTRTLPQRLLPKSATHTHDKHDGAEKNCTNSQATQSKGMCYLSHIFGAAFASHFSEAKAMASTSPLDTQKNGTSLTFPGFHTTARICSRLSCSIIICRKLIILIDLNLQNSTVCTTYIQNMFKV